MPKKPAPADPFVTSLARLEHAIGAAELAVARSLRKPAPAAKRKQLAKLVGALPAEVDAWLAWHDGQGRGPAFGPSENDRLLSADEIAAAWSSLEEEGHPPWKSSWLPLATNGAGDYLVLDRATGGLVRYQHDARARPKRARSLSAWVAEIEAQWSRASSSATASSTLEGWTKTKSPKAAALAKKPVGSAYAFRAKAPSLGKGVFVHLFWKQAPSTWFLATQLTLADAWKSMGNNLLPFLATPDRGMEHCLRAERVMADGADAPHAGLFEKHEPKPPFGKR